MLQAVFIACRLYLLRGNNIQEAMAFRNVELPQSPFGFVTLWDPAAWGSLSAEGRVSIAFRLHRLLRHRVEIDAQINNALGSQSPFGFITFWDLRLIAELEEVK